MKDPARHDLVEAVAEAYERMLRRAMEELRKAEEKSGPVLHKLIENARDKAVDLEELSREEADKLADYLKRDLTDAATYLVDTGDELKDWLGYEAGLIEGEMLELFMRAADNTTVELRKLRAQAEWASHYHTGEITGPGTLLCEQCGEKLHFQKPGRIPPCPKCHATLYQRDKI